jgi:hypothetical protein
MEVLSNFISLALDEYSCTSEEWHAAMKNTANTNEHLLIRLLILILTLIFPINFSTRSFFKNHLPINYLASISPSDAIKFK